MTVAAFTLSVRPALPFRNGHQMDRIRPTWCSAIIEPPAVQLNWGVTLPKSLRYSALKHSPPLIRLPSLLSEDQCEALIEQQRSNYMPERENYLNFDSGDGHGFRQGIDPKCAAFHPITIILQGLFPGRRARFTEELWIRPRSDEIIVRDATTVHYHAGEGVSAHVDGKDATLLFICKNPNPVAPLSFATST
eukprot:IDg4963t1